MDKTGQARGVAIFIVVLLVVGTCLLLGYDKVEANHLGVKVRLGQITGTMEPGLEWTGMLTDVYQYDMKIRKVLVDMQGAESATDKDGQAVYGTVAVNYRLKKSSNLVESLYANVGTDDEIDYVLNIEPIIREGFKQATVEYEAIDILANRQEVKEKAKENIRRNFPEQYFEIVDIVVENIDFADSFNIAIQEKKDMMQLADKAEEEVRKAKAEAQKEIEGYKADAEKMRLQKSELTALLNEQKMIEKWSGQLPDTLIVSPDTGGIFMQLARGEIGTKN